MSENSNLTLPASAPPQDRTWKEREGGRGLLVHRSTGQSPVSPPRERTDGSDIHQIRVVPLGSKEKEHGSMRGR